MSYLTETSHLSVAHLPALGGVSTRLAFCCAAFNQALLEEEKVCATNMKAVHFLSREMLNVVLKGCSVIQNTGDGFFIYLFQENEAVNPSVMRTIRTPCPHVGPLMRAPLSSLWVPVRVGVSERNSN